jgi:transposase
MIKLPVGQRHAAVVGRESGIEERTAQRWWRSYEETGEVPIKKSTRIPGRPNNFTEEHKAHVLDLVDNDPQVTVCDVVGSLTKSFEDFSLTRSAIHKRVFIHR